VNCARCETRPMIRTEALQPAAHVITAKHTCPARHIALAYPGFPSICYSNPIYPVGAWCFIREWGRIGRPSQLRHVPYPEDEAREALARRRRAKERRGYRRA
jgi:hypothetical protein